MNVACVIGSATATVKHPSLVGWRMLIVRLLDAAGNGEGDPLVAIDDLGSRRGDRVMLTSDGNAVAEMIGRNDSPVRWAVLGIVDEPPERMARSRLDNAVGSGRHTSDNITR